MAGPAALSGGGSKIRFAVPSGDGARRRPQRRIYVKIRSRFRLLARVALGMLLAVLAGACDDRAGGGADVAPRPDSVPRRVEVRLYVARDWAWNEEDTLRVTVVNGTTAA